MNTSQQTTEVWDGSIQKQLWHLRYEDPTQYQALVKMHLSFATDLPLDECDGRSFKQSSGRKWQLTPLIRRLGRTSVSNRGVMEGAPLTQEGVCQAFQLIHFLNKDYNITQEGLFRKSGSLNRQQDLKNLLNSGGDLNLDSGSHSAHDCASVLKSFLADLPEPLLTEAHYSIHCKIAEMLQSHMCKDQKDVVHIRQIKALRLLFLLLPPENYQLLQDLLILLHRVSSNQKQNLMSSLNLGTMFAPHILCPRQMTANDLQYLSGTLSTAVAFMIENAPHLFQIPLELEYDVRQYWNNKKKLKHQLSKRSLMDAPTNTIFTFIDRDLTAQANDKDVTEVALAELYAYVQSLPDSAKKRRLIKKFNHASGSGTPQLNHSNVSKKQEAQGKKLGDSIKKHLFYKTIKSSKTKSSAITSFVGSVGVKRTNSEDILSSPSKKSPELRRFQRNVEGMSYDQLRTKSLDDLSSLINGYSLDPVPSSTNVSTCSIIHPAYKPKTSCQMRGKSSLTVSVPQRHNSGSDSESSGGLASPLPLTPLALNSTYESQERSKGGYKMFGHSTFDSTGRPDDSLTFNFPNSLLDDTKENCLPPSAMLHSTPAGAKIEVHSPISEAMLRSSIPQKVIMTPRSRCPIIVNSATNLANTAIPEERDSLSCNTTLEMDVNQSSSSSNNKTKQNSSPIISNPMAMLFSPEQPKIMSQCVSTNSLDEHSTGHHVFKSNQGKSDLHQPEVKTTKWRKPSLRRTLSSASSTGSLFGNFFHHLSTSSLGQLATRLTSSTSTIPPPEEEEDHDDLSSEESTCNNDEDGEMNESLSSVFREYLLSRSILTDNPVDLSTQVIDNEERYTKETTPPPQKTDTNDHYDVIPTLPTIVPGICSTPATSVSVDSAVGLSSNASLSDSLLFCLDGNEPMSQSVVSEERMSPIEKDQIPYFESTHEQQQIPSAPSSSSDHKRLLHSCTPASRRESILKTKQGTPIPQHDTESTNSFRDGKGVLFETSF